MARARTNAVDMKNIDTILGEFDRMFKLDSYGKSTAVQDKVKSFIRTDFVEYKKELKEAVEGMKKYPVHKYNCPHIEPCIEMENEKVNDTLDSVLELLK